jgi:hypothetical protein
MRMKSSAFRQDGEIETPFGVMTGVRNRLAEQARRQRSYRRGVKLGGSGQKTTQNQTASGTATNNTNQSQTTGIDATSAGRTGSIWDATQQAANGGAPQLANDAAGTYSGYQQGGNLGFSALTGNQDAAKQFMNPYQSQVIDANNANLAKTEGQTINNVNDAATKAGAFGGSRHGVAEGVALSNDVMANQAQNANLLTQGYNTATNNATNAANLGFGAAGANAQLGMQGVGDPALFKAQQLKAGYLGPEGQTTTGSTAQTQTQQQKTGGAQTSASGGFGIGF